MNTAEMQKMLGRIIDEVKQSEDEITILFKDGATGHFYHSQDCCETVEIADVNGSWEDLYGHPLLIADERVNDAPESYSATWTFYTFRTIGGSVDVRWVGESNGYYSESVDFMFTPPEREAVSKDGTSFVWPEKAEDGSFK